MTKDAVARNRGRVSSRGSNQFAVAKFFQRGLHCALGQAGGISQHAQTCRDRFPFHAHRLAVKIEINEIRCRLTIVPDNIAHQDIDDVVVDWDCFAETRQGIN